MALFGRKSKGLTAAGLRVQTVRSPNSSLVAAAARLSLGDRVEAARQMRLRQGWQLNAWAYRDSIGELRYALNFLANCAARMRVYPAAYALGGESDNPVALSELEGETVPADVITACAAALQALGNGKLAISHVMHALSTNKSVAGECFLLGRQDPQTGEEDWSIRSVGEIQIKDDRYYLRELPTDAQGVFGAEQLDPDLTVISRIWTPHPQWRLWADSPMRSIQDDCESVLILRRMIRAAGRSRLGAGMLLIPEELELKRPGNDNEDPEADDFVGKLGEALMMPLDNEGSASEVVPFILRGPGEQLKNVSHLRFADQFAKEDADTRAELIGIIATALDLPKEIITGVADLNHWSAWQVDDNTFRHHVEPHVIHCCDSLTGAFLRPYLEDEGIDPAWVERLVFWYDPTELVTHPDQTSDAKDLYDRHALSAEALARVAGFGLEDMPSPEETVVRMLQNMRTPPANLVMAAVHQMFPALTIPPISESGTVPGVKPSGVDPGEAPALPAPGALPAPVAVDGAPPAAVPAVDEPEQGAPPAVTASGVRSNSRLSRRLVEIDRDLRARLQTAANAAMLRQLERAGAKLRSKVAKDETLRARIAHRPNERAAAFAGEKALTAAGITATELLGGDWSGLRSQFHAWVRDAQKRALKVAAQIGGLSPAVVSGAQESLDTAREQAWAGLEGSLAATSHHLLYNPDPNSQAGDWGELNPDTLVPTGTIRAALAMAGGAAAGAITSDGTGAISVSGPVGQIGTGEIVTGALADAGGETAQFEWVHGPALNPFEPHEALDGVQFASFDDEALANPGDFPDNAYFMPGDHSGCSCDFSPLWDFPGNPNSEGDQ